MFAKKHTSDGVRADFFLCVLFPQRTEALHYTDRFHDTLTKRSQDYATDADKSAECALRRLFHEFSHGNEDPDTMTKRQFAVMIEELQVDLSPKVCVCVCECVCVCVCMCVCVCV
jgi:hypothetical protein